VKVDPNFKEEGMAMAWVKRDKEGRVLDGEASRIQYFSLVIAKATAELKSGDSLV